MKRVLSLLILLGGLLAVSACHFSVNLSVEATAEVVLENGRILRTDPVLYEGFHRNTLSDSDLERIFVDLTQDIDPNFMAATLYLKIYDEIKGAPLRDETYGVVYNSRSGHYDFADLDVRY